MIASSTHTCEGHLPSQSHTVLQKIPKSRVEVLLSDECRRLYRDDIFIAPTALAQLKTF